MSADSGTARPPVYRGLVFRGSDHSRSPFVTVERDGKVQPLRHRVRHSPTGLQWGYGGSGRADLALSILWDYLGAEPPTTLYQAFKFRYVASWAFGKSWRISGEEIGAFVRELEPERYLCGAVHDPSKELSLSELRARLEALSAEGVERSGWCPACDERRPGLEYLLHGAPVWACDECGGAWWVTNGWRVP